MPGPQLVAGSHTHGTGAADVAVLPGTGAVLTAGADGVAVAGGLEIRNEKSSPITCALVNPETGTVVLGDQDAFVKVYDGTTGEFLSMATRLTLPVRCMAFSSGGATLAVAGDGEGIKLLSTEDGRVMRMLQSGPQVRDLAFDPEQKFVASVNCGGTIQVWDVSNGKPVFTVKKGAPVIDHLSALSARLAWHPDGSVLAVPGVDNDVVLYERLSWEITNHLSNVHTKPVTCVCMSPNGLYALTAGRDRIVVLWDTAKCEEIARHSVDNIVTSMVWQPSANAADMVDESGCHLHWDTVVPEHFCSPVMSLDEIDAIADKAANNSKDAANGPHEEEDDGMQEFIENDTDEHALDGDQRSAIKREIRHAISRLQPPARIQSPVQQGQTPVPEGKGQRRFLTYTLEGFITSRQDDYGCTVEVGLHDVNSSRRRMPVYTDFYGFHLASFGENGTAYASSSNAEYPSTVMYRPFEFWAPKSDWTVSLPAGEEAECVVAGRQFVAVASSQRLLRLYSSAGLSIAIISLQGPPIALAAHGDELAIVWHSGNGIEGEQLLSYSARPDVDGTLPDAHPISSSKWNAFCGVLSEVHEKVLAARRLSNNSEQADSRVAYEGPPASLLQLCDILKEAPEEGGEDGMRAACEKAVPEWIVYQRQKHHSIRDLESFKRLVQELGNITGTEQAAIVCEEQKMKSCSRANDAGSGAACEWHGNEAANAEDSRSRSVNLSSLDWKTTHELLKKAKSLMKPDYPPFILHCGIVLEKVDPRDCEHEVEARSCWTPECPNSASRLGQCLGIHCPHARCIDCEKAAPDKFLCNDCRASGMCAFFAVSAGDTKDYHSASIVAQYIEDYDTLMYTISHLKNNKSFEWDPLQKDLIADRSMYVCAFIRCGNGELKCVKLGSSCAAVEVRAALRLPRSPQSLDGGAIVQLALGERTLKVHGTPVVPKITLNKEYFRDNVEGEC